VYLAGPRQRRPVGLVAVVYCLRFETPSTWRVRSPYLYPPGTGWPSYTPKVLGSLFIASYDSQDSGLWVGRPRDRCSNPGRVKSSFLHIVQSGSGAHPASHPMGTGGSFAGGKAAGREADHSHPTSAEVKKTWILKSTLPTWCLISWAHRQLPLLRNNSVDQ
jgi:hypothetical protein